jgi:hypothetical protein
LPFFCLFDFSSSPFWHLPILPFLNLTAPSHQLPAQREGEDQTPQLDPTVHCGGIEWKGEGGRRQGAAALDSGWTRGHDGAWRSGSVRRWPGRGKEAAVPTPCSGWGGGRRRLTMACTGGVRRGMDWTGAEVSDGGMHRGGAEACGAGRERGRRRRRRAGRDWDGRREMSSWGKWSKRWIFFGS